MPNTWGVGEHIAVVGDTGTGKTYLVSQLVQLRKFVVIFRTKPDDIRFAGFRKARTADALENVHMERILLEPKYERQQYEGWKLLEKVWMHGRWTIVIDEQWYAEKLGLTDRIERLLTQGRSLGISVVTGMQRPARVSRFAISQCTHLFTFRTEGRDTKTVAEATTPRIKEAIDALSGHDFVYFNRKTREISYGNAKRLSDTITTTVAAKNSTPNPLT